MFSIRAAKRGVGIKIKYGREARENRDGEKTMQVAFQTSETLGM